MNQFQQLINQMVGPLVDAMPTPTFLVDEDVTILCLNKSSRELISKDREVVLHRRAGDILHCIHAEETAQGCGRASHCKDCLVRYSVRRAFSENLVSKHNAKLELRSKEGVKKVHMAITASPFEYGGKRYALLQFENITELIKLRQIIPVCSVCKKVRDDAEYWQQIESYFRDSLDVDFSHGICPDCVKEHYSEYLVD